MVRRPFATLLIAACAARPSSPDSTPHPTPSPAMPASRAAVTPQMPPARWSNIETVDNCFYFSGPFNGREEQLHGPATVTADGDRVRVQLGPAVFEGTLDGDAIAVARTTSREHEGAWTVTETLTGVLSDGTLRARYSYEECGPNEPCPGRCTMTADVAAVVGSPPR